MITNDRHAQTVARTWTSLALLMLILTLQAPAQSTQTNDPPHNASMSILCVSCHLTPHTASGNTSNAVGNVNLCLSCHAPGGLASRYALADSDQAITGPSLPTGVSPAGNSHRWDSGLAGHADYMRGAQSSVGGLVLPVGDYTGRVAKAYVLTIVATGQVGTAKFNWSGWLGMGSSGVVLPGGGGATNVTTAGLVALDQGISVVFSNGAANPSFRLGDQWNVYVRPDISQPTNPLLLGVITNGLLACSTCHNQHSQSNTPFDVNAPVTPGASGRHYQRINNDADQLCVECHAARNVTTAAAGSHPVGVLIPTQGFFKNPTNLPLEKATGKVRCLTCHDVHHAASSDGSLLRIADRNALCTQCHTQADTNQAAHLTLATGVLWPGGQYGSTYPAETDPTQRGMCNNCHQPHGWPTNLTSSVDYTNLVVEAGEKLCFTCHDGSPAAATNSVMNDFTNSTKVVRHPVADNDPLRRVGRSVECTDCHNPHTARIGRSVYTNTIPMTATRNLVMNPSVGASGVAVNYAGLTNFVAPGTNSYVFTNSVVYEYQICLKCHSAYFWGTNTPPTGLSANGSVTNPVETDLALGFSPMNRSGHPMITGLDNYTNSYVISGKRGLLAAALTRPWTNNVGTQTMLCTDCHNTDGNNAQGPHGSAAQFMLRTFPGSAALPANWPNVTVANFGTSWCANCHPANANNVHAAGEHSLVKCFACHIVIPHGGKVSRLIADHDQMPLRYAYSNVYTNGIISFTKRAAAGYATTDCQAGCAPGAHAAAATENWTP